MKASNHHALLLHLGKKLKKVKKHLVKTGKRLGKEDIHKLRVDIKMLRALLSMIEISTSRMFEKKAYFELFDNIFGIAGDVREAQINHDLIGMLERESPKAYQDHLQEIISDKSKKLKVAIEGFDYAQFEKLNGQLEQIVSELPIDSVYQAITLYVNEKIHKIEQLKAFSDDDKKLHKIRIHLKEIYELFTVLAEISSSEVLSDQINQIKAINVLLGDWHDHAVLRSSLITFYEDKPKPETLIHELEQIINHKRQLINHEINCLIGDLT
ncbi:MAG TPA: CHAD domain-containing protein [Cyclobacteriaceae bacterium]